MNTLHIQNLFRVVEYVILKWGTPKEVQISDFPFFFFHFYVLLQECVSTPKALPDSSCQREGEAKLGEAENRARHMSNMRGS